MIINYVNFLKHVIYDPETYHRRYDLDLEGNLTKENIKRIALVVFPFLALYRPIGSMLSLGMGGCRGISHLQLALHAKKEGSWGRFSEEIGEVALAVFTLASSPIGLAVTTAIDTGKGTVHTAQFCWRGEYSKANEEALQTLASGFYLVFMATGTLEALLISTLIQAAICIAQAKGEIKAGRYLEAAAKLTMAGIRLHQANQYRHLIEQRNLLFAVKRYQALVRQAMKGRAVRHLVHHALTDLNGQIDDKRVLLSDQGKEYDFRAHFHAFGKGLVKGANLSFRNTLVDGKEVIECEFKVNHAFRDKLQKMLDELKKLSNKEIKEILRFSGSHAETLSVNSKSRSHKPKSQGNIYKIDVKGLGTVSIGNSPNMPNLYDKVIIQMDSNKTLYDLHELMALTNLDTALYSSSKEDLDRLKIGHLFRIFFPREATPFERSEAFFTLSIQDLKAAIIKKAPKMEELFATHLEKIKESEILPGKIRYQIEGLADKVHELGGRALTAAVTGARDDQDLYKRVASLLSMGMLSQEMRDHYGVTVPGLVDNYLMGGSDSVYAQMITENLLKKVTTQLPLLREEDRAR